MRILVEPSDYPYLENMGDVTMQRTTLSRLAFWPSGEIDVFTDDIARFPRCASNVRPIDTVGRTAWMTGYVHRVRRHLPMPDAIRDGLLNLERSVRLRMPSAIRGQVRAFYDAATQCDLLVVCGMGGITDVFIPYAPNLLDTIALAKSHGATVVLFSQGVGPLNHDARLRRRASEVLKTVDFIALREGATSPGLVAELGVPADRVMVTGDDAIEYAAENAGSGSHDALGVNLRVARYSKVDRSLIAGLREVLLGFATERRAPIAAVPSDLSPVVGDAPIVSALIDGYTAVRPGAVTDPASLARQLDGCHMLFAGSYHAAVFALAQGVPTVCVENSQYYREKWLGLRHQFGAGVWIVSLADAGWKSALRQALDQAWDSYDDVRPVLMRAAQRQVVLSRQAYERVHAIVDKRLSQ